ncbi:MAG: endo alpha-1,4 polygalactosaminidase [Burkholderiaceae bacterium]
MRRRALAVAIAAGLASLATPVAAAGKATIGSGPPSAGSQAGERAASAAASWRVALHYGADAPLDQLRAFDVVVVEPGHGYDPEAFARSAGGRSELYAYVSVGEVRAATPGETALPEAMLAGINRVWHSRIVDTAHPDWPLALLERLIAPLWAAGYRGFFLDTLDAWQALPGDDQLRERRRRALVRAIRLIKQRFPQARLIANRGFEIVDEVHTELDAVAAESLYGRWNQTSGRYEHVPETDRRWLLERLAHVRALGLRTLAIDYLPAADRAGQREIAARILSHGITPYVSTGSLDTIGTGPIQLEPRKVLVVYDHPDGAGLHQLAAHRLLSMPLQYLGYRVELLDITRAARLPVSSRDRYAAVVGAFESTLPREAGQRWLELLGRARSEHVPIALFFGFGVADAKDVADILGLHPLARAPASPLTLIDRDPAITGFETEVLPTQPAAALTVPDGARPLIRMRDRRGQSIDTVALTEWGGFALAPHAWRVHPKGENWVIDPISFLSLALAGGRLPFAPDVTTENGRRLLMAHIDGDGFASRAELPGSPFAAQVMLDQFISRYRIPHTVSVIEGEVGPQGLYPALSPTLERIARRIFARDNVEIATHSYSHPFSWSAAANGTRLDAAHARILEQGQGYDIERPHLPIEGYRFSLERDIVGSARYIDRDLAPPGKSVRMMLWTGDCLPTADAIGLAETAGLLNMNGGDTTITRRYPSLSRVAPMSIRRDGRLQVYAPNQNENVYTNNWTGPFYGYQQVIETFELTDKPRRLKPIDIYYHTYSASKQASIAALHRVYRYALAQPTLAIPASAYVEKVRDFESMTVGRVIASQGDPPDATTWEIRGNGQLRTLRIASDQLSRIDWQASPGIAGYLRGSDGTYLHLGGSTARLRLLDSPSRARPPPLLAWSDAHIGGLERDARSLRFRVNGTDAARVALRHPARCRVVIDGRTITQRHRSKTEGSPDSPVYEYGIDRDAARSGTLVSVHC